MFSDDDLKRLKEQLDSWDGDNKIIRSIFEHKDIKMILARLEAAEEVVKASLDTGDPCVCGLQTVRGAICPNCEYQDAYKTWRMAAGK